MHTRINQNSSVSVVVGVVTAELCQNEEGDGIMSKMVEDLDEVKWIFLILLLSH